MISKLLVKNFGPIEFVDLDLRNVNVFIGPQASGKSALAKLLTILKAPRKFLKTQKLGSPVNDSKIISFIEALEDYNISSFLKKDTEIIFSSELHDVKYSNGQLDYTPKLLQKIDTIEELNLNFADNKNALILLIKEITDKFIFINFKVQDILDKTDKNTFNPKSAQYLSKENTAHIIEVLRKTEMDLSTNTALYIPAERSFINIIKNSSLNLLLNKVPIPKHILAFGAEVEKSVIHEIDLSFLHENLKYKSVNGEDRIFTTNEHSIKLIEAASGIQSVLPILIPVLNHYGSTGHRSFVIEEPELNLFPLAQYELIKKLESTRREAYWEDFGSIHTYTTHSPYILSALNNLLFANKVILTGNHSLFRKDERLSFEQHNEIKDTVSKIVSSNIHPNSFTAYQICNGRAESILDEESGLIKNNYIDEASDSLADDFDALLNLNKQWSNS
ncbi:hypothetical protein DVR12_13930 [Chitinophaga silvatica]|uniref:Endonuclease GajA/Old nuclease/RecF-like AAA domain-containing protein n=1 Tax=Chitinophaga silvatica TaxID=2282649 RepID=A0A3E1Y979_9BACT|nr:AAA family ATPase [Chitinophaga silvatica]RFS21756.1 hypothetical protein DVR12_13930 [Chitinophaga silvatica]